MCDVRKMLVNDMGRRHRAPSRRPVSQQAIVVVQVMFMICASPICMGQILIICGGFILGGIAHDRDV